MHLSIGKAAALLGVSVSTLRRWEADGTCRPAFRTSGGHRRYELAQLESTFHLNDSSSTRKPAHALAYARVSSHDQKQDLETQKEKLESYCRTHFESFEILSDLGSGLNYRKPGLKKLPRLIFQRQLSHHVINHKDRLLRFRADLVFELCHHFGVEVIILESPSGQSFETELAADVIELMTVFSSRLYGRRSHQNRKRRAA
jgi:predicted site-specific integrase-resolvase